MMEAAQSSTDVNEVANTSPAGVSYTFPVAQLLTYGDCVEKDVEEWPDYPAWGLMEADTPN